MPPFTGIIKLVATHSIEEYIEKTADLATISPAAVELISKISLPNTSRKDIAELVSKDEVLFTNVFKLVNSPLLALRRRPENLNEAIDILGTNDIRNLVFGVACKKTFADLDLWYKSVFVAFTTQKLANKAGIHPDLASDLYICGLMHSIGELVYKIFYRTEFDQVIDINNFRQRQTKEKEIFSFKGIELAGEIAEQNSLPNSICNILKAQIIDDHENEKFKDLNLILEIAINLSEFPKGLNDEEKIKEAFEEFYENGLYDKHKLDRFEFSLDDFKELHAEANAFVQF